MTTRRDRILDLYWSTWSTSQVAHLCGATQDRVRRVWARAIEAGQIDPPPGVSRPRAGWPADIVRLMRRAA